MEFRRYQNDNIAIVKQLFVKTFTDSEGKDEGILIGTLVNDFLTNSTNKNLNVFIALDNEKIIGCIIFSKLRFEESNTNAFLLSPVAVHPDYQGKGIGQKLIDFGHSELRMNNVQLVITYGDINFYSKVGYKLITEDIIQAPLKLSYPEGWLGQSLLGEEIKPVKGKTYCAVELNKPEIW